MNLTSRLIGSCLALGSIVIVGFGSTNVTAQEKTQTGAVLGGLAGAVTGGLIGDNNGKAGEGAAIGGVIGVLTGGLLGNAADKKQREIEKQRQYELQQQAMQRLAAISMIDVISMTASGLSDAIVINQINERGIQQRPQVSDIITLHENGVSEHVIAAMQRATIGKPPATTSTASQPSVIQYTQTPTPVIITSRPVAPRYYYAPVYGPSRRPAARGGIRIRF